MSKRQRRTRQKRRRHAQQAGLRIRNATISGSLAATAAIGLVADADTAEAQTTFDATLLKDINTMGTSEPKYLTNIGGAVLFSASDGPDNGMTSGYELWRSDGTAAGTQLVRDINPTGNSRPGSLLSNFANVNGTLFFAANDGSTGVEPWTSDGTYAGTQPLMNISSANSYPADFTSAAGTTFFAAMNGPQGGSTHGRELWKSDGPGLGATLVKDINTAGDSSPGYLTAFDGLLIFNAGDSTGVELWKSDGTGVNTTPVENINAAGDSVPAGFTRLGNSLFFSANDGPDNGTTHGRELWKTDGTPAGTDLVMDISAAGSSYPFGFTLLNNQLFFSADDGTGTELWRTDGTTTQRVKDINATGASDPTSLTNVNGTLFFQAIDGPDDGTTHGRELWKSDGTEVGTQLVADIHPTGYSSPFQLTNFNGTLLFTANNGTAGAELWKSDGTAAGTQLVRDINPGPTSSGLKYLTPLGNGLLFQADDGANGTELWRAFALPPPAGPAPPAALTPTAPARKKCKRKKRKKKGRGAATAKKKRKKCKK